MPDAPVDSFAMFYDPKVIRTSRTARLDPRCAGRNGRTVLIYLGRDANSESLDDLKAASSADVDPPYVRYINSSRYIEDLATRSVPGSGWSGDIGQARARARDNGKGVQIKYNIRARRRHVLRYAGDSGDAPHPKNAHLFIDYCCGPTWQPRIRP